MAQTSLAKPACNNFMKMTEEDDHFYEDLDPVEFSPDNCMLLDLESK